MSGAWRVRFVGGERDTDFLLESANYTAPDGTRLFFLVAPQTVWFSCPWCSTVFPLTFGGVGRHGWNGNLDAPTISGSLHVLGTRGCQLHVTVTNGVMQDAGTPPHGEARP